MFYPLLQFFPSPVSSVGNLNVRCKGHNSNETVLLNLQYECFELKYYNCNLFSLI